MARNAKSSLGLFGSSTCPPISLQFLSTLLEKNSEIKQYHKEQKNRGDEGQKSKKERETQQSHIRTELNIETMNQANINDLELSRFNDLLKPLRNIADTWNVDINEILNSYMTEIVRLQSEILSKNTVSLNFAQAALVVQGSTTVYSRKVEDLYQLVFHALEIITAEKIVKAPTSIGATADDEYPKEPDFLLLDDILPTSDCIDLPSAEGDDDDLRGSMTYESADNLILSMPLALIPPKTSDHTKDKEKDQQNTQASSMTPFRLTTSHFDNATGAILIDDVDDETLLNECHDASNETGNLFGNAGDLGYDHFNSGNDDFGDNIDLNNDDGSDIYHAQEQDHADVEAIERTKDSHDAPKDSWNAGFKLKSKLVHQKIFRTMKPIEWKVLDPYDDMGMKSKPFKRGRPFSKPKLKEEDKFSFDGELSQVLDRVIGKPLKSFSGVRFKMAKMAFKIISKSRAKEERKLRHEMCFDTDDFDNDSENEYYNDINDYDKVEHNDDIDNIDDRSGNYDNNHLDLEMNINLDSGGGLDENGPAEFNPEAVGIHEKSLEAFEKDDLISVAALSYENACRRYMEEVAKMWEKHVEDEGLTQRISEWSSKIEPLLEKEQQRRVFDIHEYEEELINKLEHMTKLNDKGEEKEQEIAMSQVFGGDRSEACRMFLTSLQLTADGNIDMIHEYSGISEDPKLVLRNTTIREIFDQRSIQSSDIMLNETEPRSSIAPQRRKATTPEPVTKKGKIRERKNDGAVLRDISNQQNWALQKLSGKNFDKAEANPRKRPLKDIRGVKKVKYIEETRV